MATQLQPVPHKEIAPVPQEARVLSGVHIGVLWGDLGVGLLVLVAGSLLVPGLGLKAALLAAVVGSVIGSALLALAGRVGSDTGVPTMVALRPALGIRGSYVASVLNIGQLVGWAGLEIIIMASAAGAISDHFFGFEWYYAWLAAFAIIGTAFAVGGPIVVARDFLQRFGVWIVVAASLWLSYRLFSTYSIQSYWNDDGAGGWPNFWQGVDIAVSLPVSWLPLVADYSRFARKSGDAAWATFISYTVANTWFFALGFGYVLVLQSDPGSLIGALVDSLLPLALGWLFLVVILADETDNAFANIYSTAVSAQNLVRVGHRTLALAVGVAALVLAISVDLLGYENFLLLIGGVFVSLFGVLIADYFVASKQRYDTDALHETGGRYWYWGGVNPAGMLAWLAGFIVYVAAAQPPALVEHASWITNVPEWVTKVGGTLPSFAVSFVLYLVLRTKTAAVGLSTFVLEWIVALALLSAFSFGNDIWGVPESYELRLAVAYATLVSIVGATLLILVAVPLALGRRLGANVWAALAVAGILTGITAYWLFKIISITNDCAVEVSVPYNWIHTCSQSA